jgi:hypothetical protein
MNERRARKEKAKRVGLALQAKYRALVEASGQDEIQSAAIILGDVFNQNIEFIINVLRDYGGLDVKWGPMTQGPEILRPANEDAATLAARLKHENQIN